MMCHRWGPRPIRKIVGVLAVGATIALIGASCADAQAPAAAPPEPAAASQSDQSKSDQPEADLGVFMRTVLGAPRTWPKLVIPSPTDSASAQPNSAAPAPRQFPVDRLVRMMLADTEDVWDELFGYVRRTYERPWLVLYTGTTHSGCGTADNKVSGPHYCEVDKKVYLDLEFFEELRARQSVSGDMSMYYVIGHEIGHHVQRLLGILDAASSLEARLSRGGEIVRKNALSVKIELQADCFAGLVAHHAHRLRQRLDSGDVETGVQTAAALGADRLQKLEQGVVQPESFTHGASGQRVRWFRRGLENGSLHTCDTFNAAEL